MKSGASQPNSYILKTFQNWVCDCVGMLVAINMTYYHDYVPIAKEMKGIKGSWWSY